MPVALGGRAKGKCAPGAGRLRGIRAEVVPPGRPSALSVEVKRSATLERRVPLKDHAVASSPARPWPHGRRAARSARYRTSAQRNGPASESTRNVPHVIGAVIDAAQAGVPHIVAAFVPFDPRRRTAAANSRPTLAARTYGVLVGSNPAPAGNGLAAAPKAGAQRRRDHRPSWAGFAARRAGPTPRRGPPSGRPVVPEAGPRQEGDSSCLGFRRTGRP